MKLPEMKTIYLIVVILMSISLLANLWNFYINYPFMNLASKISSIFGGLLFQAFIILSFYIMYKFMPTTNAEVNNIELDKLLDELTTKEVKKNGENNN